MLDISSTIFRSSSSPLMPDANNIYNVDLNTWIKNAQGVVLLFDITSRSSYDLLTENGYMHVIFQRATTYPGGLPYLAGQERFGGVLVGTKVDLTARPATASDRKVSRQEAEDWAQIQGMKYFEVDTRHLEPVEEAMRALVRSIIRAKRRDGEDLKEVKERFKRMDKEERAKRMSVSSLGGAIRRAFGKRS
jgi:GTPase SAR1 family protein